MIYFRASFELFYDRNIKYKKQNMQQWKQWVNRLGEFLSSLENDDYVFINLV